MKKSDNQGSFNRTRLVSACYLPIILQPALINLKPLGTKKDCFLSIYHFFPLANAKKSLQLVKQDLCCLSLNLASVDKKTVENLEQMGKGASVS